MKTNKLNEGLMDAVVGGIMTWATKQEIAKDPEFQKTIKNYNSEIASLTSQIEAELKKMNRKKKNS
jgi:anaerobic C4-dicarboxylate transporter